MKNFLLQTYEMKLKTLIVSVVFLLVTGVPGHGQTDSIFSYAESMPAFVGGQDSMYAFISRNIHYPLHARENGIEGVVIAQFMVDTFGNIAEIKILRGIGGGCDEEVIRLLELMNEQHKWIPGMYEGAPVPVSFTLPITFRLEGKVKKRKERKL
jgi:protein TonB